MSEVDEFDEEIVRKFYRFLQHDNWSEIRCIDPSGQKPVKRFFVDDEEEFVRICKEHDGKYNVYVGIQERSRQAGEAEDVSTIKTIIMDIDAPRKIVPEDIEGKTQEEILEIQAKLKQQATTDEELRKAEVEVDKIMEDLKRLEIGTPTKAMSGNGFYLIFKIETIKLTDDNRQEENDRLSHFYEVMAHKYDSENLKIDNIGDLPRIIKVVGTKSIKGKELSHRPHRRSKLCGELPEKKDEDFSYFYTVQLDDLYEKILQERVDQERHRFPFIASSDHAETYVSNKSKSFLRPCIIQLLREMHKRKHHHDHLVNLALATEMLHKGYSIDEIVEPFSVCADFNESKTRDQIKSIIRKQAPPHKCSTLQSYGVCLKDKCPIYRKQKVQQDNEYEPMTVKEYILAHFESNDDVAKIRFQRKNLIIKD